MIGRFRMKLTPPAGSKKIGDWKGLRVRTIREITNGWGTAPIGTVATVAYRPSGVGLTLRGDPCKCCGLTLVMSRVHSLDVEVIDGLGSLDADVRRWKKLAKDADEQQAL